MWTRASQAALSLLGLRASDFRRSIVLGGAYALLLCALYMLKPARNALFLNVVGVAYLPHVLLLVAAAGAAVALLLVGFVGAFALERVVPWFLLLGGVGLVGFVLVGALDTASGVFAFYVAVNLFGQLATALVWVWANATFDSREARRVFAFIAALGILGAFVGGFLTLELAGELGTAGLIGCAAFVAVGAGVLATRAEPPARAPRPARVRHRALFGDLRHSPLVRFLALATVVAAAVSALVDLQFNLVVDRSLPDEDDKAAFFGGFFALLNAVAFLFQLLVSSRLVKRIGLGPSLLLLPAALGVGSIWILLVPLLPAAVFLKSADVGLRHSLYRSAVEVLFAPLRSSVRKRARVLLDATFDNLGAGVGALVGLFLITRSSFGMSSVAVSVLALLGVWAVVAFRLRPEYLAALRLRLLRRELHPEELQVELRDASQRQLLLDSLQSQQPRRIHYALDLLADLCSAELTKPACALLQHPDATIRAKALCVLANQKQPVSRDVVSPLLDDPDPAVRREAMYLLAVHSADRLRSLREYLEDEDPLRWQAALGCVADRLGPRGKALLSSELVERIKASSLPGSAGARAELVRAMGSTGDRSRAPLLRSLLRDGEEDVTRELITCVGLLEDETQLPWLLAQLHDRRFRRTASSALAVFGARIHPLMMAHVRSAPPSRRATLARVFRQMGDAPAANCLVQLASELPPAERSPLLRAAAQLASRGVRPTLSKSVGDELLASEVNWNDALHRARLSVGSTAPSVHLQLLQRVLREKADESVGRLFHCLTLWYSPRDVRGAEVSLASSNRRARARGLELLSESLSPEHARLLLPVLDVDDSRARAGITLGEFGGGRTAWHWLVDQSDAWLKACALCAGVEHFVEDPEPLESLAESADPVVSEAARWALARLDRNWAVDGAR